MSIFEQTIGSRLLPLHSGHVGYDTHAHAHLCLSIRNISRASCFNVMYDLPQLPHTLQTALNLIIYHVGFKQPKMGTTENLTKLLVFDALSFLSLV